jgi:hypothetical protein
MQRNMHGGRHAGARGRCGCNCLQVLFGIRAGDMHGGRHAGDSCGRFMHDLIHAPLHSNTRVVDGEQWLAMVPVIGRSMRKAYMV